MTERYLLELEPADGGWTAVPPPVRLRKLAKAAVRAYGLRVVSIKRAVEPGAGSIEVQPDGAEAAEGVSTG